MRGQASRPCVGQCWGHRGVLSCTDGGGEVGTDVDGQSLPSVWFRPAIETKWLLSEGVSLIYLCPDQLFWGQARSSGTLPSTPSGGGCKHFHQLVRLVFIFSKPFPFRARASSLALGLDSF